MKNVLWNKQKVAENYELGRPINKSILFKIFSSIKNFSKLDFHKTKFLDAGCGTGRISIPIAKKFPELKIVGLDFSSEMLTVLKRKILKERIENFKIIKGNLFKTPFIKNEFDIVVVSSVLHGIKDWQQIVDEIIRVTKSNGLIILLSEESDICNMGLNRITPKVNTLSGMFWGQYLMLRKKLKLPNPETTQIGIKWQLGCPDIVNYLKKYHNKQLIQKISYNWEKVYQIKDFMKILINKPWSSMFMTDENKYNKLIEDMKKWLIGKSIKSNQKCISHNKILCEILK